MIWILVPILAVAAWLVCAYVAFSRTTVRTVMRLDEGGGSRLSVWGWKYPYWRSWALVGLVLIPSLAAVGVGVWFAGSGDQDTAGEIPALPISSTSTALPAVETPLPDTPTPSQTPTEALATATLTRTPTPVPTTSATPTAAVPTASATPSQTPIPSETPAAITPTRTQTPTRMATRTYTATPTATRTQVPTATASPSPSPSASATPGVVQPQVLAPLVGREYKNPVAFEWRGSLSPGQAYEITAYHVETGAFIRSYLLSAPEWTVDLPAERVGEWRWWVTVVSYGNRLTSSPESMFWFNPLPGTRSPKPKPTATRTPTLAP
jgi:hypothetical protein